MFDFDKSLIDIIEFKQKGPLPDLFTFEDGKKIQSVDDWPARRQELYSQAVELQFGCLPPEPEFLSVEPLDNFLRGFRYYKITTGTRKNPVSFTVLTKKPEGEGPFPVVISGDLSLLYARDNDVFNAFTDNGIMPVFFSRIELAPDRKEVFKGALHKAYPEYSFATLAAWAWGYSRVVDALDFIVFADKTRVAFTGHSRGGKTALLAGICDKRAQIVHSNNSGCGGSGCYRVSARTTIESGGSHIDETLKAMTTNFPHWLNPKMNEFIDGEESLPFDQHFLKALIAPRTLLISEGASDCWANPIGSYLTTIEAQKAFEFLGAEDKLLWYYRKGGHGYTKEDAMMLVNVIKHEFFGEKLNGNYFKTPFDIEKTKSF